MIKHPLDHPVATDTDDIVTNAVAPATDRVVDPVCGMKVDPATSPHHFEHEGASFHFCGNGCRVKFAADPDRYLHPRPAAPVQKDAVYTCPMHPEIRQIGPGACPICGMGLDPDEITAEAPPNPELDDMTRRFWVALVLTLPVFILEMGTHVAALNLASLVPMRISTWVQFMLSTPVVLWAALPFFQRGWASVRSRHLNMFTLISLGTGAAYLYSLVAAFLPDLFPPAFRDPHGLVPVYFEAAAVITVLLLLGQVLELRARARTGDAVRALLNLAPPSAWRLREGGDDEEIPVGAVNAGDRLRVRPGAAIAADGEVVEGRSDVNEAMITGEAMPVAKQAGDRVIGGTLNGIGALVMRADKVGAESTLSRIVAMVVEAQRSRAPIQLLADAVASWFVPAVLVVATLTFVAWGIWGPAPALSYGLIAAVSVLIIACPCALGLATPMSIGVGVAVGAGAGVLIRSAEALQRLEKIDTLVIDKTGTLTEGRPRVTAIITADGFAETDLLGYAADLERSSEHPLGAAILAAAREQAVAAMLSENFQSVTGQGVRGMVSGRDVALGNAALMQAIGVDVGQFLDRSDMLRQSGATTLFMAIDQHPAGMIVIADRVKPTTRVAIDALRADGVRVVMLTGDNRITAASVAKDLGIVDVEAEMQPHDKQAFVRRLKQNGAVVAMAGDGVNDAPALAEADVGIAMGTGTEVAIRTAGVTLVQGDLAGIVRARMLSRAVMRNIRQNLFFAFAYNIVGIPVAAGVLYPALGLVLSPMVAALAMSLSSVSVIGNALRLNRLRL